MSVARVKRAGLLGWPLWVWVVILALAGSQPLAHLWIVHFPPAGTVPTGMHIPDSALFLYSMRMFETGFESLYATCKSPYGTHYLAYYPLTYLWMYGGLGVIADWLGFGHFLFYGCVTGVCGALYLAAVYGFLRQVVPRCADAAFLLFTLSGGLGGVSYAFTGVLGLHDAPLFDRYFMRYAMYELLEGPHLLPVTHLPRLYYTLPLALCLTALTLLIRNLHGRGSRAQRALAMALLQIGFLINLRCGAFVWAIAAIYLWQQEDSPLSDRIRSGAVFVLPAVVAGLVIHSLWAMNPAIKDNMMVHGANMAMWLSPFLSVVALHLLLVPREIAVRLRGLSPFTRLCAYGAVGYLAAFAVLFGLYQAYYGNIMICRDAAVANAISDWALIGAVLGIAYAWLRRPERAEHDEHGWVVLWLLAFVSISLSAFGQGWFLRFGPHRLQVLIWLPLCILSALGLHRLWAKRPVIARALGAAFVTCGVSSVLVAVLCFQTPLGRRNGCGPYPKLHVEVMTLADAHVLTSLGPGRVLAPSPAGDVVVFRRGNPVVYGIGSFNLSDQPYLLLRTEVERFFAPETPETTRHRVIHEWCVDYVYCPDTWPIAPELVEQLWNTPWLEEVAKEGRAALFRVLEPAADGEREIVD